MRPICFFRSFMQSTYRTAYGDVAHSPFPYKAFLFIPRRACGKGMSVFLWTCTRFVCVWAQSQSRRAAALSLSRMSITQDASKAGWRWAVPEAIGATELRQTPAWSTGPSRLPHGCVRHREQLSLPGGQAVVHPGGFLKLKIMVIRKKSTT